jgi:hypothetical protein
MSQAESTALGEREITSTWQKCSLGVELVNFILTLKLPASSFRGEGEKVYSLHVYNELNVCLLISDVVRRRRRSVWEPDVTNRGWGSPHGFLACGKRWVR